MAKLVAAVSGWRLLDDPEWAIDEGALSYRTTRARRDEVGETEIVKCPRMTPVLPEILTDFPEASVVFMLRDPRDIWRSIQEKIRLGRPTRMLRFEGIAERDTPIALRDAYVEYTSAVMASKYEVTILPYDVFFSHRIELAHWVAGQVGAASSGADIASLAATQLGPTTHKDSGLMIAGCRRWRHEPDPEADAALAPAVDAYHAALRWAVQWPPPE